MKIKLTLIITLLFLTIKVTGQEEKKIANKDGINVTYQLILEKETKKKDKYILIVNAINEGETDLYYSVALTKNKEGKWQLPYTPSEKGFTKIKARNSTGIFGNGQSIIGDQTKLITTGNSVIYKIKKGNIYTRETTFKVKTGVKPLITNTFTKTFKNLDDFDLKISSDMLNGDYTSSCGNMKITINVDNSTERGDYILQTTNGKQFIWIRKSETTFTRENSEDYTLTYNKSNNTFSYSTSDGITCIWSK